MSIKQSLKGLISVWMLFNLAVVQDISSAPKPRQANQTAIEQLESVPIFVITDDQGKPLVIDVHSNRGRQQIIFLFIAPSDAEAFLEQIRPQVRPQEAKIFVTSLRSAYGMVQGNKDQGIEINFVPSQSSITSAKEILQDKPIPVVPIFYAISKHHGQEGMLTIEVSGRQRIPLFFERTDLDRLIKSLQQHNSEIAQSAKVEVTSLFTVLDTMLQDKVIDFYTDKLQLVPARSTYDYINSLPKK